MIRGAAVSLVASVSESLAVTVAWAVIGGVIVGACLGLASWLRG